MTGKRIGELEGTGTGGSSSSNSTQRLNPLLFPIVTSEVFRYLGFQDLKSGRVVCRSWEKEAYKQMRGKHRVRFTNYLRIRDYINNLSATRKDFCDSFQFGPHINISTPYTNQFFNDFGAYIKTLDLQQSKWKEPQLKELLFDRLPNLENLILDCLIPKPNDNGHFFHEQEPDGPVRTLQKLKVLSINIHAWEQSFDIHPQSTLKTFLIDLFLISPNLESITCPKLEANYHPLEFLFPLDPVHVNHFINGEVVDALDELNGMGFESNIRRVLFDTLTCTDARLPALNSLGELDICMTLREEQLRKLSAKNYPLKSMDLTTTQNVTIATLHGFLSRKSQSLQNLKLRFLRRSPCTTEFPSAVDLKNLRKLELTSYKGSFEFIRHLENLDTLKIIKINRLSSAFPAGLIFPEPLRQLKTLEIFEEEQPSGPVFRQNCLRRLGFVFPNLVHLRLDYSCDSSLRAIFGSFPKLEELIIRNGRFTDSGLTGFSSSRCQSIRALSNYDNVRHQNRAREELPIFSLKNLRVLDLNSKELTDVGMVYGILQCEKLRKLTIQAYKITDISMRKIVTQLQLDHLRTEFCYQLTMDLVNLTQKTLPSAQISINEYEGPMKSMEMWKFLKRNNTAKVPVQRLSSTEVRYYTEHSFGSKSGRSNLKPSKKRKWTAKNDNESGNPTPGPSKRGKRR